ncbi:MAG: 16S rRNA (cytosine(1402)-N(4))-methyltransferase RsmH, partial [Gammaproteobacteria bacterium]
MGHGSHIPVLLAEVIEGLNINASGFYIDLTYGRGGHAQAILDRLGPEGKLLVCDKDPAAVRDAERRFLDDARVRIVHADYADYDRFILSEGVGIPNGVLMDLGVSSPQLDDEARGFSFKRMGPLDMRMDSSQGKTAADWLAVANQGELERVIRNYGEERYARRVAKAIVEQRKENPLKTTFDLAELVRRVVPPRRDGKDAATRTFQAIRIFVNQELVALAETIEKIIDHLAPGGRLAVISFHSLEDRVVKRCLRRLLR